VAPVSPGGGAAPEREWVEISIPGTDNSRPRFSPDGLTVYYVMGRAGERILAAQRLDRSRRKRAGDPIVLSRAPLEITALTGGRGPYPLAIPTQRRLYYSTRGLRGNVWMTRLD
jgi:hypothetical protein